MEQQIFTTAACETKSMKYKNFKFQMIKIINDDATIYTSCGGVVTDFVWEAKTRCNF